MIRQNLCFASQEENEVEEDYGLGLYDLEEGTVMRIPDVTFIQKKGSGSLTRTY